MSRLQNVPFSESTGSFWPGPGEAGVPSGLAHGCNGLYLNRGSTAQPGRSLFSVVTAALNKLGSAVFIRYWLSR